MINTGILPKHFGFIHLGWYNSRVFQGERAKSNFWKVPEGFMPDDDITLRIYELQRPFYLSQT